MSNQHSLCSAGRSCAGELGDRVCVLQAHSVSDAGCTFAGRRSLSGFGLSTSGLAPACDGMSTEGC